MRLIYFRCLISMFAISLFFQIPGFLSAQQAGPGAGPGPGAGVAQTTLTTFETDDFSGSGICAMCHSSLTDEAGTDVSNDAQWRSTMMANAAKDPLWQARISSEVDRALPEWKETIENKCSRCHCEVQSAVAAGFGKGSAPATSLSAGWLPLMKTLSGARIKLPMK